MNALYRALAFLLMLALGAWVGWTAWQIEGAVQAAEKEKLEIEIPLQKSIPPPGQGFVQIEDLEASWKRLGPARERLQELLENEGLLQSPAAIALFALAAYCLFAIQARLFKFLSFIALLVALGALGLAWQRGYLPFVS
ncbi:MAG: hypothetical protein AAF555_10185 [Verrucomicrobiota bacterium]